MADFLALPDTPEKFIEAMGNLNVLFPLTPSSEDCGVLLDDAGDAVLTVDVNSDRPDEEVELLTAYVCMALNKFAGFDVVGAVIDGKQGDE